VNAFKQRLRSTLCLALALGLSGCARYRLCWGEAHGHTAQSDGQGTVADYFTYARQAARLDFAMVTDHDFGHGPPWRLAPEAWAQTQQTADALTADGRFVAIAGYEWTSQAKYWTDYQGETPSERLFPGPPRYYNHKNVYFPTRGPALFSAKEAAYQTPDLLAGAARRAGGLIHNCHPDASLEGRDQWDYQPANAEVIANTEMNADQVRYQGKLYQLNVESVVRKFLQRGGRTGFVGGSDTHEGKPAARTAVYARGLSRQAIFEALAQRRCYAVTHDRIRLKFQINGAWMGAAITAPGPPRIRVEARGSSPIAEITLIRNGETLRVFKPGARSTRWRFTDHSSPTESWYYVRVTLADTDADGNPSRAWSSPIWVRRD
jgi:hypothetical protein